MDMIDTSQGYICGERLGNFPLHLHLTKDMLWEYAASGHNNYLKSSYIKIWLGWNNLILTSITTSWMVITLLDAVIDNGLASLVIWLNHVSCGIRKHQEVWHMEVVCQKLKEVFGLFQCQLVLKCTMQCSNWLVSLDPQENSKRILALLAKHEIGKTQMQWENFF